MQFQLKIAGLRVFCTTEYDLTPFCKEYIDNEYYAKDEHIYTSAKEYDFSVETNAAMGDGDYDFPISEEQKEFTALLRRVSEHLPSFDRMLMHGSCISYKGKAFILIAPHATGKSTHTKLWINNLKDEIKIVNGDKPILRFDKTSSNNDGSENADDIYVCGSPWRGKENYGENMEEKLFAVVYLSQAKENRVEKVDPKEYIGKILSECYVPEKEEDLDKTIELVNRLFKNIPLYHLECNMDNSAYELLKKTLY